MGRTEVAEMQTLTSYERDNDATYISNCAGQAEAGWKATIAAIDELLAVNGANYKCAEGIIAPWKVKV